MRKKYLLVFALTFALNSCFTGIESTPRITNTDVKKEHIETTAEQRFLNDITVEKPSAWQKGKKFRVTDNRINRVLSGSSDIESLNLKGADLTFVSYQQVPSVSGNNATMFTFITNDGKTLDYKVAKSINDINNLDSFTIPFTVDLDVVDQVRSRLVGNRYYIVTPMWYNTTDLKEVEGLRHIPVDITDVRAGTDVYPIMVVFRPDGFDNDFAVLMTIGDHRTSTRNFDTLLAFDNPRVKYPQINDEIWQLIKHSKVKDGMTKTECRLALGAPNTIGQRPTTAGMVEYWSYTDGRYLLFDDGVLITYR